MEKHAIVVVTYNRINLLKECLEAIESQSKSYDFIVVVNNASTDGTTEYLKSKDEDIHYHIIHEPGNIGGAGGFAHGIRAAYQLSADWITIIDDDAILREDFLSAIQQGMEQMDCAHRCFAGIPLTDGIRLGHRRVVTGKWIKKEQPVPMERYQSPYFYCDIASFCGLVIHRTLLQQIGLPKKDFFIWYDDTEYCLRISKYEQIVTITNALIDHKVPRGQPSEKFVCWKDYYGIRNRIYMSEEHYGRLTTLTITFKKIVRCALECLKLARKQKWSEALEEIQLYKSGIRDGFRGKLGFHEIYRPGK